MSLCALIHPVRARRILLSAVLVTALSGLGAASASANLAAGSFVFDGGSVNAIVHDGSNTFAGGAFTQELANTGGGLIVPSTGAGTVDPTAFPHVVGDVRAAVSDGSGGWFIGGFFSRVAGVVRTDLAHIKADGTVDPDWDPEPIGGGVLGMALSGSTLYVAGSFTSIGGADRSHLAALSTTTGAATGWDPSPNQTTFGVAVSGSTVYAAGAFTSIGGKTRAQVAAVDMETGQATDFDANVTGGFGLSYYVTVAGSTVYMVGYFDHVGGASRSRLASVDATTGAVTAWNPSPDNYVQKVAVSGSNVYVVGQFNNIGGQPRRALAAVDATTGAATAWHPVLTSDDRLFAVAVSADTVYVGGLMSSAGGEDRRDAAAFDTTTAAVTDWNPGPNGYVDTIALAGSQAYVGGAFTGAGDPIGTVSGLAKLSADGNLQTGFSPNPDGSVSALAASGGMLYVGGDFASIGGQSGTPNLAVLDPATGSPRDWSPGTDGAVKALAVAGSNVYVGGEFSHVGGSSRGYVAAVDVDSGSVTSWDPEADSSVYALAVSGSTVYAGGAFAGIGGSNHAYLAALDTGTGEATTWAPEPDDNVFALALSGSTLYVGGDFGSLGGQTRYYAGAVDTGTGAATGWDPEADSSVYALAVSGSTAYVGGDFENIGGAARNYLAAVDTDTGQATTWDPSGDDDVLAVAVSGATVYAGGAFGSLDQRTTGPYAQLTDPNIDTTPPVTTIDSGPSGPTNDNSPSFTFSATDTGGGPVVRSRSRRVADSSAGLTYECSLDEGDWAACTSPKTFSGLADGSHIFSVRSTDAAGNIDPSPPTRAFTVDTTAPVISVTTPAEGQHVVVGTSVTSVFACADTGGTGVATCTGPAKVDATAVGPHTFTVNATDNAGNAATKTVNYVVDAVADTTAPTITITAPTEGQHFTEDQAVTPVFACADEGGSGVATCAAPTMLDTAALGAHTFTVNATDNAGNVAAKTVNYTVDPAPTTGGPVVRGGVKLVTSGGSASFVVNCTGTDPCDGTLTLTTVTAATRASIAATKALTIGKATYSVGAGKRVRIHIKLNATGRKLLRQHNGRLKAKLIIKPAHGTPTVKTVTLRAHYKKATAPAFTGAFDG